MLVGGGSFTTDWVSVTVPVPADGQRHVVSIVVEDARGRREVYNDRLDGGSVVSRAVEYYGVGAVLASGLIVDGMHAFDDNLWAACDCALGRGENLDTPTPKIYPKRVYEAIEEVRAAKLDWVRRARKFAANYFGNDAIKMTRCLKRVSACKQLEDLTRTYAPVDYTQCLEKQDNTTVTQTVACSGGKCELI